ncbi:hypothetical protein AVEN_29499-1 [Araneus ventricosus]|uniref:Uncharacterized protein n=1 Tax=Araneus ventricosus TaxID=182803 RepID=A0A4Y2VT20_ARAVE|nr:hypothetical protein AVEN_29499-1 [Araneus ventricosus]
MDARRNHTILKHHNHTHRHDARRNHCENPTRRQLTPEARSQIAKKACLKGFGNLDVGKGKGLSQRFPRQGLNLSARLSSSLFQTFQKVVKSPPSAYKIKNPPKPYSHRGVQPPLQSRTPTYRGVHIPLLQTSS